MKKLCFRSLLALSALTPAMPLAAQTPPAPTEQSADWRETWAYHIGLQAVVYGYPVVKNLTARYQMIERPNGQADMPLHTWFHSRRASDHTDKLHSSPAPDLLYSAMWFDLRKGPLVITVPDDGGTYISLQFMEMYSDIFAYVGTRETGGKAGTYLLAGQDWQGEVPAGIARVIRSPTPTGLIMLRAGFSDRNKLQAAHALQDKVLVEGLNGVPLDHSRDVLDPAAPGSAPLPFFAMLNRGMSESPPPPRDGVLMAQFAGVGLGPGQSDDFSKLDSATRRGLERAMVDGLALIRQVSRAGGNTKLVNHWAYGQMNWGRTASQDDFLTRSTTQSFSGMMEHWIEEVVKLRAHHDGEGRLLDGSQARYTLRFTAAQIPIAKAFWSVSVYDSDYDLVANPRSRFSLGSLDRNLRYDKDGGLTLYLQPDPPAKKAASNWLPIPRAPFNLFLRAYLPDLALQRQDYAPPPVTRVP
jgi:hypothetical protein